MTLEILNQRENFDQLVKNGYKIIKLTKDLTPMDAGFNKPGFIYETKYRENQNYGLVGGSTHKAKDGNTGKLLFVDFDVKEKYLDKDGKKCVRTIPKAIAKLGDVSSGVCSRNYYFASTKSEGLHMGILTNENIPQGVSLYAHQDCEKLRIDTRTEVGYVVAIASNYQIKNIPETFDSVIPNFEQLMLSLSFIPSNKISNTRGHSGSFSIEYKRKAREALDHLDAKMFPELGTEKVSTHDFVSFCVMSCKSRNIPLDETTEKIMCVLAQINTSKNNITTEKDIEKLYNKEYPDFEPTAKSGDTKEEKTNTISSKEFENKNWSIVSKKIQNEIHFVTIRENKEIWYYSKVGGIYKPFGHTIIEELCQKYIHKCKRHTVAEVIDTIRRNKTMIYMADLMESRDINTQNGLLDPRTFELKPHSYEYLTTTKLPFSVNHNARNLKLWKHILTIIDPYDINKFMELIWILISWNNPHKKEFVFKGDTNTQKSALVKIITWIIGIENLSKMRAKEYLQKDRRFGTNKFIGKRGNIETEIGGLNKDMLEAKKSMIGGEPQNTERKGDNTEYIFDPEHFVFISTTNDLGEVYSTIDDNSAIGRYQFMICRNKLVEFDGLWYDAFFEKEEDKQSAIDTIVSIVINYKKAQSLGKIPKTKWSSIEETKQILREQMPIEDKYFADERIIRKEGSILTLEEIKEDYEPFVGYKIKNNQEMGNILSKNGIKSTHSNGKTIYKGYAFNTAKGLTTLN